MAETPEQALAGLEAVYAEYAGSADGAGSLQTRVVQRLVEAVYAVLEPKPMSTADFPVLTEEAEPQTEAGRDLLDHGGWTHDPDDAKLRERILAIEAEARANQPALSQTQEVERLRRFAEHHNDCPGCGCDYGEDHGSLTIRGAIRRACSIIELADHRAMAADGPVSHVRDEMSDAEWRLLYDTLNKARALTAESEGGTDGR